MDGNSSSNPFHSPLMEVLSYGGTSQYTAGGPSACGLASAHAALLVLSVFGNASSIQEAYDEIRSQEFIERIMNICSLWTHNGHLDVDDILALPMFASTLGTLSIDGNWCNPVNFRALYKSLKRDAPTVAIITRPPEIVALFNIPTGDSEVPFIRILFDSHPRPHLHPKGAAFIFFFDEDEPVKYLSSLFQTDKSLVESRTWDASLLGQYTAHVLTLKMASQSEAELAFYRANIRVLEEQANLRAATARETALSEEVASLMRQLTAQQQKIDRAMAEETVSRDEMNDLRREVERLKITTSHGRMPGAWVEPASWRSRTPPRAPSTTAHDYEFALSLQNGYPKHAALGQGNGGGPVHAKSSFTTSFWPFNSKPATTRSENSNPNENAHAYEQVRQQYAREEMSRLKGKGKETLTTGSTSGRPEPPVYRFTTGPTPPRATTYEDSAHARALQAQLDTERASYDLARQLQAQEDATVREHEQLVQEAARVKLFECVICMEEYPEGYSAPIKSCGHVLCRTCMKAHVQAQVDQAVWPVRCPTCVADASRTEQQGAITRDLIETLGVDEELLVKWVKLEMEKVSVAVECPGCHETALVDVADFREAKNLSCPLGCGAHWCKQCNRTFERDGVHSCDGQAELDQLLGQNNWKKCPACQVPVEKVDGCNHMSCRCHCAFCYICGAVISNSTNGREIQAAKTAHFQNCRLW